MDQTPLDESQKPRHIRDIAHLYISRIRDDKLNYETPLFFCGETRDCFSSLHASNIIAGISVRANSGSSICHIRVFELSYLLPNIGYYFSLAPRHYLRIDRERELGPMPLFLNSEISFDLPDVDSHSRQSSNRSIDLIHLPPLESGSTFYNAIEMAKKILCDRGVFLLFSNEGPSKEMNQGRILDVLKNLVVYELNVKSKDGRTALEGSNYSYLGSLYGWENCLIDRFPVVARNPECTLSRMYMGICESLLYRLRGRREGSDAISQGGFTKGIEAGRKYR